MKNFESIKVFLILAISLIGFSLQGYRITSLQVSNASSIARLNEVEAKIDSLISNVEDAETIRALNNITLSNITSFQSGPFAKDEQGWWVAEEAMFRFPKGIVIGARNTFCNYGEGTLSVNYPESLFSTEGNCPEGKGSVVFGQANTASGKYSSVLGGYKNTASGDYSSVSGGSENIASGDYSSVSGGYDNLASIEYSSVFGGETVIKQELESSLLSVIPFTQDAGGWWVADKTMFRFPQGVVVGAKSSSCTYGEATLSVNVVDDIDANCPEGEGSVTFGRSNTASGEYSAVLGGYGNAASGFYSSISGGFENSASGAYSSVSGGSNNFATSTHSSVYGGEDNFKMELESTIISVIPFTQDASGWWVADMAMFRFPKGVVVGARSSRCAYGEATLSVSTQDDTLGNCPEGDGSVTFGRSNTASAKWSSVLGGYRNTASGKYASVSGGSDNTASGENASVSGGSNNVASKDDSSVFGGEDIFEKELTSTILTDIPFTQDAGGWWVADMAMFRFPKGVVVGARKSTCAYGEATLSVSTEDDTLGNCPEGDGSVTFGRSNTASGKWSSVLGGYGNTASGKYASVLGGSENTALGDYSSVSGGSNNAASSDGSSVYGGEDSLEKNLKSTILSDIPFTQDALGWWVADMAMFRFPQGVVIGARSSRCAYGDATLSVSTKDDNFGNCPEGDGSVTFGRSNTASGKWSSVLGGYGNTASGDYSSVSGGSENSASGDHASVSGGIKNLASSDHSSVFGGEAIIKKELENSIISDLPFTQDANGWWVAEKAMFRFPQGVVVGAKSSRCTYGEATLSVNGDDDAYANCPEGRSSVTFGRSNTALGEYSAVLGGYGNTASGKYSSVSGGADNSASGEKSSVSGGSNNFATSTHSSVYGGEDVFKAELESSFVSDFPFTQDSAGWWVADKAMFRFPQGVVVGTKNPRCTYGFGSLSVNGDDDSNRNCPEGEGSVTFGFSNTASGKHSSVLGGYRNSASGSYSSVSGGSENSASGENSSVSGGSNNLASSENSSMFGGETTIKKDLEKALVSDLPFTEDDGGWWVANAAMFRFPKGIVVGAMKSSCAYGDATLSVNTEDNTDANCPEGDGSVTFGQANTASGKHSVVLGGYGNTASGSYSSISGGSENSAVEDYSSVSGGSNNMPFTKDNEGWWVADDAMYSFPKGIVVGPKSRTCSYGKGTLSVNADSADLANCPEGDGSVSFGKRNIAKGKWSTVLGGNGNSASANMASVLGGDGNKALGEYSTVSAGSKNIASGVFSSVSGGTKNSATNNFSSVSGGTDSSANGIGSSVAGGFKNLANGATSAVIGGISNVSSGRFSSISGGHGNNSPGYTASVGGGFRGVASGKRATVVGGQARRATKPYQVA